MATIVGSGSVTVTDDTFSTLWSATGPGIYVAVAHFTETAAADGDIYIEPAVAGTDFGISPQQGAANGNMNFVHAAASASGHCQVGPWVDVEGTSSLTRYGNTVTGTTSVEWWVVKMATVA